MVLRAEGGLVAEATGSESIRAYRPDIDGLRAFAITAVVLYHVGVPVIAAGYFGVDIFFVISGYLIGGLIHQELAAGTFRFVDFYARRLRRIAPALIGVVLVLVLIGWPLLSDREMLEIASTSAWALLGVSNIHFALHDDYFFDTSAWRPMLMTWSLGVEEQFYLCLPVLLIAASRLGGGGPRGIILGLTLLSLAGSFYFSRYHGAAAFYLLPSRAWELGAGVWLSISRDGAAGFVSRRVAEPLGVVGLVSLAAAVASADQSSSYAMVAAVVPVAGTMVLLATPTSFVNSRLLAARPAQFVGRISYSWYLWHWPLLTIERLMLPGEPSLGARLAVACASFVVACLSWRFIEQPFRRRRSPAGRTAMVYGAALAAAVCMTLMIKADHGMPWRVPAEVRAVEAMVAPGLGNRCLVGWGVVAPRQSDDCLPTHGPADAVALLGDSHAAALSPGLQRLAALQHFRLLYFTKAACRPIVSAAPFHPPRPWHARQCREFMTDALERIVGDATIRTVVMAALWARAEVSCVTFSEAGEEGPVIEAGAALAGALPQIVDRLVAAGKAVVLVGDVPNLKFNPSRLLIAQAMPNRSWLVRRLAPTMVIEDGIAPQDQVFPRDARVDGLLRHIADTRPNVTYIDAQAPFHAAGGYQFERDGILLYLDDGHVSPSGAALIRWPRLVPPAPGAAGADAL
jgi:peptidoglycan/LPS O-acetylase OafA/YrhL